MSDPLESARYMLARAKHHAQDLEGQADAFFNTDPYTAVVETNTDANEDVHKIKLAKPLPVMLNGIASDAICNLRSALDQAGHATAMASGKKGRGTHFPFGAKASDVESCRGGISKLIPNEIFDVVASFKPYKSGDERLWVLNDFVTPTNTASSALPQ